MYNFKAENPIILDRFNMRKVNSGVSLASESTTP